MAIDAAQKLEQENKSVRVVSMPCTNIFDRQDSEYKNSILPNNVRARLAIEAGNTLSMSKYVGLDGKVIGIDTFGASAPANVLFNEFGFTIENVVETAKELL